MLTVDQAWQQIANYARRLPAAEVPLRDACGHVLAADVASDIDSPPHDKAMMDGYAVVADDTSEVRRIVERVLAGDVPSRPLSAGEATQVMTGAPIPDGATAVVPVEQTERIDEQTVRLTGGESPVGRHILPRGTSVRVGEQVVARGTRLRPIEIAVLAEVGRAMVDVIPQPRVAVLATGNELVDAAERPGPGQIRNSNGPMLLAAIEQANATAIELPVGRDDQHEIARLVEQGLAADVLLVSGGVSAGEKDLVPAALAAAGVEQVFHKVALKPGKPLWFGAAPRQQGPREAGPPRLVFGLPGNPVSGLVCFHLFVRPAFDVLAGRTGELQAPLRRGRLASSYDHAGGRETFRPARCVLLPPPGAGELPRVEVTAWQGSADVAGLVAANCLLRLPPEPKRLATGDEVEFLPLGGA